VDAGHSILVTGTLQAVPASGPLHIDIEQQVSGIGPAVSSIL